MIFYNTFQNYEGDNFFHFSIDFNPIDNIQQIADAVQKGI